MEKEKLNKQNKPDEEKKEGYIIVTNYFLKKWVKVLGVGPVVLYEELLTYCHKGKYIAWPTINSLCQQMGIAKTTLLRYQNTLIKFGLIKNITRGKSTTGHYRNNIYQITSLEELSRHPDPGKIIDFVGSKMKPDRYQKDTSIGSNMKLSLVSKRYPNNTNLNSTNVTTTNREKDVVVAVVDFKKLKEKGEEKMRVIRERMVELDFKEELIEKILKEYSTKKIDEKLDLLLIKRNIQSPAGWLSAALKNDYQDPEQERYDEEPAEQVPRPSTENKKILSREEALQQIQLAKDRLAAITPSYQIKRRWQKKKGEDICQN
ncbi:unnamed protein product [marine sediment metagenome]|uniref:Helix-turn-helix domain-containing protein n=1 Tax=marine sediment metagenome TaxID=412755 RepID=X0ZXX2_9ZZZZ